MTKSFSNGSLARADAWFGLKMTSVAAIAMAVLLIVPSALTLIYSLHNVPANGSSFGEFVGLRNYQIILTSQVFWRSVQVTLIFTIGFVVLSTLIGFAMALLLNQQFFGRGLARALLIVPWATPWLVIGILWKWYADGSVGGLNALLVGIGVIGEYQNFLSNPNAALFITIIAAVWRQASFAGILLLAGLQTLPNELNEAAELDGANWWQRLQNVTIPWLRPVLVTVTVLNIIYAFLQFDVIFAMTQGGPGDATQVLSILIYRQLFVVTQIGLGSALAVVLGVAALVGGLVTVKLLYRGEAAN